MSWSKVFFLSAVNIKLYEAIFLIALVIDEIEKVAAVTTPEEEPDPPSAFLGQPPGQSFSYKEWISFTCIFLMVSSLVVPPIDLF
ncbi:MAG: hypothetical protein AB2L14_12120 [Candidatus Xenobiia bacterium LiM19]